MSQYPDIRLSTYPFNEAQIARLKVYKAAVAAGFFSDTCPVVPSVNIERLSAYRAAILAGLYSEFPAEGCKPRSTATCRLQ